MGLIHSFSKYFLSTHYMLDTALGTRHTAMIEEGKILDLEEFTWDVCWAF